MANGGHSENSVRRNGVGLYCAFSKPKQFLQIRFEKLTVEPPPPTLFKYWVPVHHPPQFSNIEHRAAPIHTRMAYTPTDYWFSITPQRAVALIGEDHMGEWSRSVDARNAVSAVVNWHTVKNKNSVTLWHEGETSAISASFRAFQKDFARVYTGVRTVVRKWEPPASAIKYTRESLLLIGLMAGDAMQTRKHLGTAGVYLERLLQTHSWKADSGEEYTADEILKLVDKGVHAKRYRELLHSEITDSTLREWFELREEAFENPASPLYKIMMEPQHQREDGLARLMRSYSGVYLVGESHIGTMRGRGLLK